MRMNSEIGPQNGCSTCCDLCGSSSVASYLCEQCGAISCYVHAALWQDDRRRCFHCFSRTTPIIDPSNSVVLEIPSVPDRDRRLLLVLDGLYVAGAQRHCLSALEALGNYGFECTVLALEGGGQWADRFVKAARRVVIPSPTSISWENIGSLLGAANFELVIAHLVAPILWSNDHIPKALRCYAHLHSEPSEHEEVSAEMLKSVLGRFERFF